MFGTAGSDSYSPIILIWSILRAKFDCISPSVLWPGGLSLSLGDVDAVDLEVGECPSYK